ncbi:RAVE subunit 2/Rogdi [Fimicolochytrium jonesii]|uniref:RAVE subunit 2/Rogdi n=1 Tax=Fimicolochytrium jonesii TaxID=1396493 RepID=UPI0022FEC20B|nr:RAVE subunit 2/Rogdi [Fimicolochytrium jonesii]KAI8822625.1 RAVE subunit 2/Rogdi [Fimicolochytrium jonesii]
METQAPPLITEIVSIINTGLSCSLGSQEPTPPSQPVNPPATLAITSANSDLVKGFLTIDGASVIKGDLTLKLPHYNRGNAVKVTINPARPTFLRQVSSARNHLIASLDIILQLAEVRHVKREKLHSALRRVSKHMKSAKAGLCRVADADIFPVREGDATAFAPDLPEDLVVDLHVMQSNVVVSIYALNYHQSGIPLQIQSKILGKFRNLKLDTYKGKPVEILDTVTVESASPRLATLIRSIDTVEGLCDQLILKLNVFRKSAAVMAK